MACKAAGELLAQGIPALSPIAHSHGIATECDLDWDWKQWADFDAEILAACEAVHVLMLPGWQDSEGIENELSMARDYKLPIAYLSPDQFGIDCRGCPE